MCLSTRPGMGDRDRPEPLHLATLPQDLRLQVPKTSGKGNVEGADVPGWAWCEVLALLPGTMAFSGTARSRLTLKQKH
eukprot:8222850-Alexandrium_andersonii.AAC.1